MMSKEWTFNVLIRWQLSFVIKASISYSSMEIDSLKWSAILTKTKVAGIDLEVRDR